MPLYHIIRSEDKERVKRTIDGLKDGVRFDIRISRFRPRRSIAQNKLYWLWVGCLHEETGNDRDTIHDALKTKFLGTDAIEVLGVRMERPRSSRTLTTAAFTDYLDKVQAWAASEFGIRLPQPGDAGWEEFFERYGESYGEH